MRVVDPHPRIQVNHLFGDQTSLGTLPLQRGRIAPASCESTGQECAGQLGGRDAHFLHSEIVGGQSVASGGAIRTSGFHRLSLLQCLNVVPTHGSTPLKNRAHIDLCRKACRACAGICCNGYVWLDPPTRQAEIGQNRIWITASDGAVGYGESESRASLPRCSRARSPAGPRPPPVRRSAGVDPTYGSTGDVRRPAAK